MRLTTFFALVAVATAMLSCRPSADPTGVPGRTVDYTLRLGDAIQLRNPILRVTVRDLADSRCPTGVACIVAGSVVVSFVAEGAAGRETFSLSLSGNDAQNEHDAPSAEVQGHILRLRRVDPYPVYGRRVLDSAYRLVLIAR